MKVYFEIDSISDFEAWSGGNDTKNRLIELDAIDTLDSCLDDIFPNGCDETELNDFLWFDTDTIAELIGHCNADLWEDGEDGEE